MPDIQRIETVDQLDALLETAADQPVWIFKHSLTCPISASAYREYRRFVEEQGENHGSGAAAVFALVEVQKARPVSNAVAERTGVVHQSPQALLLKGSEVAWHASHGNIRGATLARASGGGR